MNNEIVEYGRNQNFVCPIPQQLSPQRVCQSLSWLELEVAPPLRRRMQTPRPDNLFVIRVINKQVACQHRDWHERLRR